MDCGQEGPELLLNLNDSTFTIILDGIDAFATWYSTIHKFLTVFICVLGILANIVHIIILTRPVMKRSTVNRLFSFMACCDIVKMCTYLIYMIRFNMFPFGEPMIDDDEIERRGYAFPWIVFLLSHITLSIDLHTTSLYLSVCTAFIRYKAINQLQSVFMKPQVAWKLFVIVFVCVGILCVPTFMVHEVYSDRVRNLYTVGLRRSDPRSCMLFMFNLWLTGIFFKVLPCACLIFFTIVLVCKLHRNQKKQEKILSKESAGSRSSRSDRTTLLLILLLFVFIVTELPQGFLAILNGIYPTEVHAYLYTPLGEVLDLLSLINGNACFILYPCISSQYRESFRMLVARARQDIDKLSRPHSRNSTHKAVQYQPVDRKKSSQGEELKTAITLTAPSVNDCLKTNVGTREDVPVEL